MDKNHIVQLLELAEKLAKEGGGDPPEMVAAMLLMTAAAVMHKERAAFLETAHIVGAACFTEDGVRLSDRNP